MFNVLDNAVKYGDENSMIEMEVAGLTNFISVAVRNRGVKIDQEDNPGLLHNQFQISRTDSLLNSKFYSLPALQSALLLIISCYIFRISLINFTPSSMFAESCKSNSLSISSISLSQGGLCK